MCFKHQDLKKRSPIRKISKQERHFHPLEFMARGSETQPQVGENLNYLTQQFKG